MFKATIVPAIVAALLVTGCAVKSEILESKEATAIGQTVSQAKADLQCPRLTYTVISKQVLLQPVPQAQYTIRVTGCGTGALYTVTCAEFGEDYKECAISPPGEP